jgi:hypothetical protein
MMGTEDSERKASEGIAQEVLDADAEAMGVEVRAQLSWMCMIVGLRVLWYLLNGCDVCALPCVRVYICICVLFAGGTCVARCKNLRVPA